MNTAHLVLPLVTWFAWLLIHAAWIVTAVAFLMWVGFLFARHPLVRHALALGGFMVIAAGVSSAALITWPAMPLGPVVQVIMDRPQTVSVRPSPLGQNTPIDARAGDAVRSLGANNVEPHTSKVLPVGDRGIDAGPGSTAVSSETSDRWCSWAVAAWAMGVFTLMAHHAMGALRVGSLRKHAHLADAHLAARFAGLAARLGVPLPALLTSDHLAVPAAMGWWRPAVLLPVCLVTGLPAQQLDAILLHELAHLHRRDWLVEMLVSTLACILFYHPAVWWMAGRLRDAREQCCDEAAVRAGAAPETIARALLTLAERMASPEYAISATGGDLASRVRRLLGAPERPVAGMRTLSTIVLFPLAAWALMTCFGVAAEPASTPLSIKEVVITPHGPDADLAFMELQHRGGARVIQLGGKRWMDPILGPYVAKLVVPSTLRFMPVTGPELIRAVASEQGLNTAWVHAGTVAILFAGARDDDIERLRKDMASADPARRADAAWRAGWLDDVRAVPSLIAAAQDPDVSVRRQALAGLNRLSWDAVVEIEEPPVSTLEAACASGTIAERTAVIRASGLIGGNRTLAFVEKKFADQDADVRVAAIAALGRMGGDHALALLGKALIDGAVAVRAAAAEALGSLHGDQVAALLEKALADQDDGVRTRAVQALRAADGDRELALLMKALDDRSWLVRTGAVTALGSVDEDRALPLLTKALTHGRDAEDQNGLFRLGAFYALGAHRRERVLPILESALANEDLDMQRDALIALGIVGGERALALVKKARTDHRAAVQPSVAITLGSFGSAQALALLDEVLDDRDVNVRTMAVRALALVGGNQVLPLLKKALADKDATVRRAVFSASDDSGFAPSPFSAVGLTNEDEMLALLEKEFVDEERQLRAFAACALGSLRSERALARLGKAIGDQDESIRVGAAMGLGSLGDDQALAFLKKALSDKEAEVRLAAVRALMAVGGGEARDLFLTWIATEPKRESLNGDWRDSLGNFAHDQVVLDAITRAEARLK